MADKPDETTENNNESGSDLPENAAPAADVQGESLDEALSTAPLIAKDLPEQPVPSDDGLDEDEYIEVEQEDGLSFSARALITLLLLVLGGGLALWGGPKLAPHLPNGMAGVKAWLLPGQSDFEGQLAELRRDLDTGLAQQQPSVDADQARSIAQEVTDAQADDFNARIAALADQVTASDSADIEARISKLETQLSGISEQMNVLGSAAEGLSEEAVADLSRFAATIEGIRAEIGDLAERDGAMSQRIDEVAATAERRVKEAETEVSEVQQQAADVRSFAVVEASLASISAALASGAPFQDAVQNLAGESTDPLPDILTEHAETGVATFAQLRTGFSDAAHAAIRADIQDTGDSGVAKRFAAFVEAQVASRSLTPQEGDSTDAVLSRAEDALRRDDLAQALTELNGLSAPAAQAMAEWTAQAQARLGADDALAGLQTALLGTN